MNRVLAIRPEAEAELELAFHWYQTRRAGLGIEFLLCIDDAIDRVRRDPESFPPVFRNVRLIPVSRFPFVVYFVADPDKITIVSFFHGSRDPAIWKARL